MQNLLFASHHFSSLANDLITSLAVDESLLSISVVTSSLEAALIVSYLGLELSICVVRVYNATWLMAMNYIWRDEFLANLNGPLHELLFFCLSP